MVVDAKNCVFRRITSKECVDFCNKYHSQGAVKTNYNYGLFYEEKLVQILSFDLESKERIMYDFELCQECTKEGFKITGGKEKLLQNFIQLKKPHNIVSLISFPTFSQKDFEYELLLRPFQGYIYKTTCLLNGKIYIGQHRKEFDKRYLGSGKVFSRAIEKYGKKNFKIEVLEYSEKFDYRFPFQEKLNELEKKYIKLYNAQNPEIGYNILEGGQVNEADLKSKFSQSEDEFYENLKKQRQETNNRPEVRQKISERVKDAWSDGTLRKQISESMKERWKDPEYQKRYYEGHTKAVHSEEYRENMSRIVRGYYEDDDFRRRMSDKHKEMWQDEEYRKTMTAKYNEANKNEVRRKRVSEGLKKAFESNPELHKMASERAKKNWIIRKQKLAEKNNLEGGLL